MIKSVFRCKYNYIIACICGVLACIFCVGINKKG